eukprot:3612724-Amphidinium_carterae.1
MRFTRPFRGFRCGLLELVALLPKKIWSGPFVCSGAKEKFEKTHEGRRPLACYRAHALQEIQMMGLPGARYRLDPRHNSGNTVWSYRLRRACAFDACSRSDPQSQLAMGKEAPRNLRDELWLVLGEGVGYFPECFGRAMTS